MARNRKSRRISDGVLEIVIRGDEARVYDFMQFLCERCSIMEDDLDFKPVDTYGYTRRGELTFGKFGCMETLVHIDGYWADSNGNIVARNDIAIN